MNDLSITNEKAVIVNKILKSVSAVITGLEIQPSKSIKQYKANALKYGQSIRGEYTNDDTDKKIVLMSGKHGGIKEVLEHDYKELPHLQSIAAIPQIIKNCIFLDKLANEDKQKNPGIDSYEYYISGLVIGGIDYTVKVVIGIDRMGDKYYDHKLSRIEKGKLLEELAFRSITGQTGLSSVETQGDTDNLNPTAGDSERILSPLSEVKDKRLLSLLQKLF